MHRRPAARQIGRGDKLSFLVTFGEDEQIAFLWPLIGAGWILAGVDLRGTAKAGGGGERTEQERSPRLLRARVDLSFRDVVGG